MQMIEKGDILNDTIINDVPLNILNVKFHEGLKRFINKFTFCMVSLSAKRPYTYDEEPEVDLFGTPLDDDNDDELEEVRAETEEEEQGRRRYGILQNNLTRALIKLRADGADICRVRLKGGNSLIMCRSDACNIADELLNVLGDEYKPSFITPLDMMRSSQDDLINLLTQYMEYKNAEKNDRPVPKTMLLYGYYRHQKGQIIFHVGRDGVHTADDTMHLNDYKNSFSSLYVKDSILHVSTVSYYEKGS